MPWLEVFCVALWEAGTPTPPVIGPPPARWELQYYPNGEMPNIPGAPVWHIQYHPKADAQHIPRPAVWAVQYSIDPANIPRPPQWTVQYSIDPANIAPPPQWTVQYSIDPANIIGAPEWTVQYDPKAGMPNIIAGPQWRVQYHPKDGMPNIIAGPEWTVQYDPKAGMPNIAEPGWTVQYHPKAHMPNIPRPTGWTVQYRIDPANIAAPGWTVQYHPKAHMPNIPRTPQWTGQYHPKHGMPAIVQPWHRQYRMFQHPAIFADDTLYADPEVACTYATVTIHWDFSDYPSNTRVRIDVGGVTVVPLTSTLKGSIDYTLPFVVGEYSIQAVILPRGVFHNAAGYSYQCWQEQYEVAPAYMTGWTQQYVVDPEYVFAWVEQYDVQAPMVSGWTEQYAIGPSVIPVWHGQYRMYPINMEGWADMTIADKTLQYRVRLGRNEAAFGARCATLDGQLILENADGEFDALRPNTKITWYEGWDKLWAGWVSDVRPGIDHSTGLKTAIVHIQGALQQVARADYEIALFLTDTVRTGGIVKSVMDHLGRAGIEDDIDHGQVRIHPAHYMNVLTPRQLTNALRVLRATEQAEIGYLHEERGDSIVFNGRFHRETQQDGFAAYTFGTSANDIKPFGVVEPDLNYDNIYTVVEAGAERAVVQATGRVYTLGRKGNTESWTIPPNTSVPFRCDLVKDVASRESEYVKSVAAWDNASNVVEPDTLTVAYSNPTRTGLTVTITNPTANAITLTKVELYGQGVALYGDLTLPPLEDTEAIAKYGRRSLNLPTSFIGDGTNHGGDATAEGRAFAEMLLARYSNPVITATLRFSPRQNANALAASTGLRIGDPVTVTSATGLPAGVYRVEGMEFHMDAAKGENADVVAVHVSKRDRARTVINRAVSQAPTAAWVKLGDRELVDGELYIVGVWCRFASGSPTEGNNKDVLRLVNKAGKVIKQWDEIDIPVAASGDGAFLGSIYKAGTGDTIEPQIRYPAGSALRIVATRWVVLRTEI